MNNIKMLKIYISFCFITLLSIGRISAQNEENKSFLNEPELKGTIVFDFGFTSLIDAPRVMNTKFIQSNSVGLYYMRQFLIGKKISFNPALGFTVDKYSFAENVSLDYIDDGTGNGTFVLGLDTLSAGINLKKSNFTTTYIEASVELRYFFKNNESNDWFYLAVGGFAGIRIESHTKIKFVEGGVKKMVKKRNDFQQKSLRYGLHGRIGYKNINLFYKQSFSSIFNNQGPAGTINTSFRTIGISISGF